MVATNLLTVTEHAEGQRLDNFLLKHFKNTPRSYVYRIVRKGEVRVNKGRIDVSYRLKAGDIVRIPPVRFEQTPAAVTLNTDLKEFLSARIIHQDNDLLVINKPIGMAVHAGTGLNLGAIEYYRNLLSDLRFLELAHRLDRDTSGCLLLAKNRQALLALHELFKNHEIRKRYLMLVFGQWPKQLNKVDSPLEKKLSASGEHRVYVREEGQEALTHFAILKRFKDFTLVEAFPQTGRTHQIRVHAASSGHPIVGDVKYAKRAQNQQAEKILGTDRLFLHAGSVKFNWLKTGEVFEFQSPVDEAWEAALARLE